MDRRTLLTRLGQLCAVGIASRFTSSGAVTVDRSTGSVIGGYSYLPAHREALRDVTAKMVKESSEMWQNVRDRSNGRNPVIITLYGNLARSVTFEHGYVIEKEVSLNETERAEFHRFREKQEKLSLGLGQILDLTKPDSWRVRAFVKNGRSTHWNPSIEKVRI